MREGRLNTGESSTMVATVSLVLVVTAAVLAALFVWQPWNASSPPVAAFHPGSGSHASSTLR